MSKYAYWNQNTGQIARYDEPNARLERLDVWHPIDPAVRDKDAPAPVLDGLLTHGGLPYIPPPPSEQPPADEELPEVKPPGKSASKADWMAFAVEHRGADPAEAEALNRDQLAEKFGDTDGTN